MRLQRYILNERRELSEMFPTFYKDCKPFINEWLKSKASSFFYRNTHKDIKTYEIINSHLRSGRSPMDTPPDIHRMLNDWFRREFGWNVRDGVCTSGEILTSYGYPSLFFPIGKYEFVWSDKVEDLFKTLESNSLTSDEVDYHILSYWEEEWEDRYGVESGHGHWELDGEDAGDDRDAFLDDLKDSDHEKWLDTAKNDFYWVPDLSKDDYMEEKTKEWFDGQEERIFDFLYECDYRKGNMLKALNSANEVVFKCNRYYLINLSYEQTLIKLFKRVHSDPKQLTLFNMDDYM